MATDSALSPHNRFRRGRVPLDLVDADLGQKLEPRPPRPDAPLALIKHVRAASTLRSISLSRFAITVDLAASA